MDQIQRGAPPPPRVHQFHPSRNAIVDLFNLYLGRNLRQKTEDVIRESPNKSQKRITAFNRDLPPRNEQFVSDFEQLQTQFADQEQLRAVTESVLITLVVQCSSHTPRAEFLLFALRSLCTIGYVNWDTFLPSLLSSVSSAETSIGQASHQSASSSLTSTGLTHSVITQSSSTVPISSTFHSTNPASPLTSMHGIGSPAQSVSEPSTTMSPIKSSNLASNGQKIVSRTISKAYVGEYCVTRNLQHLYEI